MDKSTVAVVLFAFAAGGAAVAAVKADFTEKFDLFKASVATAAAGLFVLFQNVVGK